MSKTVSSDGQFDPVCCRPVCTTNNVDRSRNIVIIEIDEKTFDVWHQPVTRALKLCTGRYIRIDDAFRLGKFDCLKMKHHKSGKGVLWKN